MSVMNQLKKFSENPEPGGDQQAKFDRTFLNAEEDTSAAQGLEAMTADVPIPGQSLTQDPDARLPFEGPPQFTDVQDFLEHIFTEMTGEDGLPMLLDVLRSPVPVETTTHKILQGQFRKGNINMDLLLLAIEPTLYILLSLAAYAGIHPTLFPEGDGEDDEESQSQMIDKFKQSAQELAGDLEEDEPLDINDIQAPTNVPRNLMDRVGSAVDAVGTTGNTEPNEPTNTEVTI